ncbi:MAG TPA: transposase [Burkholderiales bacterium]|nr:transposase [Burkholderiales bacterium]
MPRLACPEPAGVALHLVQRGRNRAPCFSCAPDRTAYLDALRVAAAESASSVHAYAVMGNHVHLLATLRRPGGAGILMRSAAEGYARYLQSAYGHEDRVWDERYDGTPVLPRRYLLACMRYIELNPVRAGLVREAHAYGWSSYRANAEGADDPLVTPHPLYCALGRSRERRCAAYRALFAQPPRPTASG